MKKTIVIIDDSLGPITYYKVALEMEGYAVQHIRTAREALQHINHTQDPADLYLVDIMIPIGDSGLSEKEVAQGLTTGLLLRDKLRQRFPHALIEIITNVASPDILQQLAESGNTSVLYKPETPPDDMVTRVKILLAQAKDNLKQEG